MAAVNKMPVDMSVDVLFEDERWQAVELERLAQQSAVAVVDHLALAPLEQGGFEIAVLACDDARIAGLNQEFRGKITPTNVLSWPSEMRLTPAGHVPLPPMDPELGDIAVAYETCLAEAQAQNKDFSAHLKHLLIHGVLHLLGYDHIDDTDAALMERLEVEILEKMDISNPYET